ncbi:hypothetical protein HMPREF1531_00125 [Propionibacterium sp. oral taxon 192 str. F0372]|uniref:sulfite exporter TauE/SafE family protein n=1 Tax=Propionibacterium sp. oral taxon 192 TaxID=671222 RepID=UPI000352ED16|nr:sulfite exporter TauE/SafE family protein [Propionibacterium sp. oral taxon 192]EPH07076.1 hypothetical protein HMPREF1531_00125 [Propionibacterium sp. oral taxon 192 str. F0372]
MRKLLLLGMAGLVAQFVDGALGMGYGVTSSSMLLVVGLSPALASASVHLSEIGTNAASALAHVRLGNVDRAMVIWLGVPGAVGAFLGATVLSSVPTDAGAPIMSGLLACLGGYILVRFTWRPPTLLGSTGHSARFLAPLGVIGGFVDATGGGGWGPVTTTTLLSAGRSTPRRVIGSVSTAEFLVSSAASAGFLLGLGTSGISLGIVLVLLAGGVVAAPLAALVVSKVPARIMGVIVGGMIVVVNLRVILDGVGFHGGVHQVVILVMVVAWAGLVGNVIRVHRRVSSAAETPRMLVGVGNE